jgi:hypothetical protein
MSALGLYGALVVILAGSVIVGRAILSACRWRRWSWLEPAIGLAALVLVAGLSIGLGRGIGAAISIAILVVASSLFLWSRSPPRRTDAQPEGGYRDSRDTLRTGLAVALLTVLAASLPFAAAGDFGVLGKQVNHDLGGHIYNAEWLRSHEGIEPDQVASGYPVGPHGLAAAVHELTGIGLAESFTAMLITTAVVTALASLAVFRELPPGRRTVGCLLVGLSYLAAAFYVQSAFKETLMGMLVLVFALTLREVSAEGSERPDAGTPGAIDAGVPLGLLAAAAIQIYSVPGLSWLAGTAALWALAALALQGPIALRAVLPRARPLLPVVGGALAVLAVASLADLPRLIDFTRAPETQDPGIWVNNIFSPIPPYEALGVWLSSDFRFEPVNLSHAAILVVIALAALALGIVHLARRRELALLAGLVSVAGVYLGSRLFLTIYLEAKALAIASPLIMLVALRGVFAPASAEQRGRGPASGQRRGVAAGRRLLDLGRSALRGDEAPLARAALGVAFAGGALASIYLVLAGASVDRSDSGEQLAELRSELEGERVLFLGNDAYAAAEFGGATVRGPGLLPRGLHSGVRPGRDAQSGRFDFDTVTRRDLDWADFVITTGTRYASEPPPNFHKLRSVGPNLLWERDGPTPVRRTLAEKDQPGAVLDCSTREGRRLSAREGVARAFAPQPAYGRTSAWVDLAGVPAQPIPQFPAQLTQGRPVRQTIRLAPGLWHLSLQYASPEPLELQAPSVDLELPPRLDALGPFWPAGTIEVSRARRVTVTVQVEDRPWLPHLLGTPGPPPKAFLGAIAAAPVGEARKTVPLREACGELVDWYRLR